MTSSSSFITSMGQGARVIGLSFVAPDERTSKNGLNGVIEQVGAAMYAIPVLGGALDLALVGASGLGCRQNIRHAITGTLQVAATGTLLVMGGWAGVLPAMAVGAVIAVPNFIQGRRKTAGLPTYAEETRAAIPASRYADKVRAGERFAADIDAPNRKKLVEVLSDAIADALAGRGWGEHLREGRDAAILKKLRESGQRAGTLPADEVAPDSSPTTVFRIFENHWIHVVDDRIYLQQGQHIWVHLGLAPLSKTLGTV